MRTVVIVRSFRDLQNTESRARVAKAYDWRATPPSRLCPLFPVADAIEITPEIERDLVRRAQSGNEDAFGTLMRSHYEPVFRLVNSMLRDDHSARDVCQEVWLTVWKNLGSFRGDSKFSTWIHP